MLTGCMEASSSQTIEGHLCVFDRQRGWKEVSGCNMVAVKNIPCGSSSSMESIWTTGKMSIPTTHIHTNRATSPHQER